MAAETQGSRESKTLVAAFSSESSADAAVRALKESGVPAEEIRRSSGVKGSEAFEPQDQSSGSLMDWLLGEEAPVRDKSIYSGSAGRHVIAVAISPSELERLTAILQAHAPSSLEVLAER